MVNSLKSLACVVVVIMLLGAVLTSRGHTVRSSLILFYRLIRQHRFTIVPLALVSLVSIIPGPDILDQVPDIVRRWTDGPGNFALEGGFALLSLLLFSAALFLIGRMRTAAAARFWDKREALPLPKAPLAPWVLVPLLIFVIGVLFKVFGAPVGLVRLGLVCAVPLAIGICSIVLRNINNERDENPLTKTKSQIQWSAARIGLIMRVGDAVAIGLVVAAALAALRATLPVVLLAATQSIKLNGFAAAVLTVACVGILVTWPIASYALVRLGTAATAGKSDRRQAQSRRLVPVPGEQQPFLLAGLPIVCVGVAIALYVAIGFLPETAGRFGVLFCLNLTLMSLTGIVTGLGLVAQRWAPVEFFQLLHLRSTPMLTLLIILVVIAGFVPAAAPIHQVRSSPPDRPAAVPEADNRDGLLTTVDKWAEQSAAGSLAASCRRTVTIKGRTAELMPMLLVASEGGGIRAAEWTVQAMQRIASEPAPNRPLYSPAALAAALSALRCSGSTTSPTESLPPYLIRVPSHTG